MSNHRAGANRRKLARLEADMSVTLRPVNRLRRWTGVSAARGVDFNRYGMGVLSRHRWRTGAMVLVDIDAEHMILRGLRAHVASCRRVDGQYRVGLRFYRRLSEFTEGQAGGHVTFLAGLEDTLSPIPLEQGTA